MLSIGFIPLRYMLAAPFKTPAYRHTPISVGIVALLPPTTTSYDKGIKLFWQHHPGH